MISGIGLNFGTSNITSSLKAGVPAMDASLNEGKTEGKDRAIQRSTALEAADTRVQTKTGGNELGGPAREAARNRALGREGFSEQALIARFLEQNSDHAPGPKLVSALVAENQYLQARAAI
ncbi:hypothetical protein [Pseudophaeobacter sp. EL27]|uniref:hypothetical protein n=1 Tax=Pseudophaeobacter sp. EL27 TaxID=2107580 RepID=UPI000EFAFCBE|nr:hypothetical protein [Pseudophaeobacter sp. EL27]